MGNNYARRQNGIIFKRTHTGAFNLNDCTLHNIEASGETETDERRKHS